MDESSLLTRLRQVCLRLPEVRETVKWGHPTFEAGRKIFAVLDRYEGRPCIAFRTQREKLEELLTDKRFREAPYAARYGWVCLYADGLDWVEVEKLLLASYRLIALKRMLAALDASRAKETRNRRPGSFAGRERALKRSQPCC